MVTYVDVNPDTGVTSRVGSRERHKRSRSTTASTGDCDLGAGDIELSAIGLARTVQGDVLNPQEVVTGWCVLWNGYTDRVLIFYVLVSVDFV